MMTTVAILDALCATSTDGELIVRAHEALTRAGVAAACDVRLDDRTVLDLAVPLDGGRYVAIVSMLQGGTPEALRLVTRSAVHPAVCSVVLLTAEERLRRLGGLRVAGAIVSVIALATGANLARRTP